MPAPAYPASPPCRAVARGLAARLLLACLALCAFAGLPGPAKAADLDAPGARCRHENFNPRSPELSLVCSDADLADWLAARGLTLANLEPVPATLPDGRLAPGLYATAGGERVLLARYVSNQFHAPAPRATADVRAAYLATLGVGAEAVAAPGNFMPGDNFCEPGEEFAIAGFAMTTYSGPSFLLRHCSPSPLGPYFGRRILYHEGHTHIELSDGIDTVRWLAGLGFEVYAAEMPLFGRNTPDPEGPPPPVLTHEEYADFERAPVSPLFSEFLAPVAGFIAAIREGADGPVGIIGRSGGGMTAYSIGLALPTVDYVISIAGGTPLSMRLSAPAGPLEISDWEQWSPRTYSQVGHEELQRHSGRLGSLHLYGGLDPCCFRVAPGDGFHEWLGAPPGDGRLVEIFADPANDQHALSEAGKPVVTGFIDRLLALPRLDVSLSDAQGGRVVSNPAGIDCAPACTALYPTGQSVELTATTLPGYVFAGWSGACSGTGPCTVAMTGNPQVMATFTPIPVALAVSVTGEGTGTVTSQPAGIDCGAACSSTFPSGSTVTLVAIAAADSVFSGWGGACTGTGPCQVTMSAATQVTAGFARKPVALQVARSGDGTGRVTSTPAALDCGATCAADFAFGTVVTLAATPDAGSVFTGWAGDCSGTGPCVVTMSVPRQVSATFTALPVSVAVTRTGNGNGTVTSQPAGVDCGATCTAAFPRNTVVTMTAAPAADATFTGWGGACTGTGPCTVTVTGSLQVTAGFALRRYALQAALAGDGAGTVTSAPAGIDCGTACAADFDSGTAVTLTATPAAGSSFAGWSGACTGSGPCPVTMDAAKAVTATFVANQNVVRLANISTRMQVLTGNDVLIAGFVVGGATPKTVAIRARGPSLAPFGIANPIGDPQLQLFSGATQLRYNDDWQATEGAASLQALGMHPADPKESALLVTLAPGAYTAIVSGVNGTTGVGIVEVFEMDNPVSPLVNISSRGRVFTGNDVMIGGFVIQGSAPQTVIVRARGPSLADFGLTEVLSDPVLQVFDSQQRIGTIDDWQASPDAARIRDLGYAPAHPFESAMLLTLPPGAYTAVVTGGRGSLGVAIVEVFALPATPP